MTQRAPTRRRRYPCHRVSRPATHSVDSARSASSEATNTRRPHQVRMQRSSPSKVSFAQSRTCKPYCDVSRFDRSAERGTKSRSQLRHAECLELRSTEVSMRRSAQLRACTLVSVFLHALATFSSCTLGISVDRRRGVDQRSRSPPSCPASGLFSRRGVRNTIVQWMQPHVSGLIQTRNCVSPDAACRGIARLVKEF